MKDLKVRAAKMTDESALLALAKDEMEAHARLDKRFRLRDDAASRYAVYLRDRMRDIDSTVFVAELAGEVVGLAIATIRKQDAFFANTRYGYVSDLMVAPARRRNGIGRALYERTTLWFRGFGIEVVRLHVAMRSDEARAFWNSVGADEFLVEAWIDLEKTAIGAVEDSGEASAHSAPAAPSASETPVAAEKPAARMEEPAASPPRSGFDYPGDVLAGGEGGR